MDGGGIEWNLPPENLGEIVEVDVPEVRETDIQLGDKFQLGNHILMCGDSTKSEDVYNLLKGVKSDLVVTDPPYNMNYQGAGNTKDRESKKIANDNLSSEEFRKFLLKVYTNFYDNMKDGSSIYVFYKELGEGVFIQTMRDAGITFKQELIWVKDHLVLGGSKYQSMYEPCLFGCKGKQVKNWYADRKQRSVIESIDLMSEDELRDTIRELLDSDSNDIIRCEKVLKNDLHPTMKPIKLLAKFIRNSSKRNDVVLDLFGGSGSTLITCEQMDRVCYTMEYDPKFCQVIIDRWEQFTGKKCLKLQ